MYFNLNINVSEFCDSHEKIYDKISPYVISRIRKKYKFLEQEDLEQEIYLAIWLAIKSYDSHKNFNFGKWIGWAVAKTIRNFSKNRIKEIPINLEDTYTFNKPSEQEFVVLVNELFKQEGPLSDKERVVIYESIFNESTLGDIGLALAISDERARQIKNQGLKKIKCLIE